jgi:predicted phage terminase large subunit-like protein
VSSFSNEKEFLQSLDELQASLRSEIEAHALGLDPSPEAVKARRRRVLHGDFRFFAYNYFPHHIFGDPSLFQAQFCKRFPELLAMDQGCKEWWVAPRGECKSSLLTKIGPCYLAVLALLQKSKVRDEVGIADKPKFLDYVILLGAETKMPTKLLAVVKTELESNPSLQLDFPEVCGRGYSWKVNEIVTRTGVKVEPFGAEQAIRGTFHGASRPKVIFPDDIITDSEAKSPTERDNRWNFLEAAIDYLGPPDGSVKVLGVGTILNKDDIISRAKHTIGHVVHHFKAIVEFPLHMDLWEQCEEIMRNQDKQSGVLLMENSPSYQFYVKHKKAMDKGAVTSWPSVRSLYVLMRARAKNARTFGTEMQGDARADEDKVFTNVQFWVQKLPHWVFFGACDPSMGKTESADPSAIVIGGFDTNTSKLHVVHADIKRRVISKLGSDLIAVQKEFHCPAIGFENNNAYEHSRSTFIKQAADAGVSLPLVGVTAVVDPMIRIDSLEPFVNDMDPRILFHASLRALLAELDDWPEKQSHHHYDGLTALHILWMIAISRASGLPKIQMSTRRKRQRLNTDGY